MQDPYPEQRYKPVTSMASGAEKALIRKLDPLSPDPIESIAGLIIRSAVSIGRYQRSIINHPERTDHYQRLIRCTTTQACVRVCSTAERYDGSALTYIAAIQDLLDTVIWDNARSTPIPRVAATVPDSGTEQPFTVSFIARPHYLRSTQPA